MTDDLLIPDDEREVPLDEEDDRRNLEREDFDWPDEAA